VKPIKKTKPLSDFLPKIFDKVAEDKNWAEGTLKKNEIMFVLILNYFGKLQANSVNLEHINDFSHLG
jgi:hypothetical protein